MVELTRLWRLRGAIPVPVEADDPGLMSRVAHVFEEVGVEVVEEYPDGLRYRAGWLPGSRPGWRWTPAMQRGSIDRDTEEGRPVIRYDQISFTPLIPALLFTYLLLDVLRDYFGYAWPAGLPGYLLLVLAFIAFFILFRAQLRSSIPDFVRRAFAT